jgi:hypothetical protein
MNNTNISVGPEQNITLSIICVDTIEVKARVTFDSEVVDGIQVTYWMDDDSEILRRIDKMFDYLFEEVLRINESVQKNSSINN